MTITLQLPPQLERRLRNQATNRGLELSEFVVETLSHAAGEQEVSENPQEEDSPWRGVFTVSPNREVLASRISLDLAGMSETWKPQITIDPTRLSDESD